MSGYPCTRKGWAKYYQKTFGKTQSQQDAVLAMWYELLYLAFGDNEKNYKQECIEAKGIYM